MKLGSRRHFEPFLLKFLANRWSRKTAAMNRQSTFVGHKRGYTRGTPNTWDDEMIYPQEMIKQRWNLVIYTNNRVIALIWLDKIVPAGTERIFWPNMSTMYNQSINRSKERKNATSLIEANIVAAARALDTDLQLAYCMSKQRINWPLNRSPQKIS